MKLVQKVKDFVQVKNNWFGTLAVVSLAPFKILSDITFDEEQAMLSTIPALIIGGIIGWLFYSISVNKSFRYKIVTFLFLILTIILAFIITPKISDQIRSKGKKTCEICGYFTVKKYDSSCELCGNEIWKPENNTDINKEEYIKYLQIEFFSPIDCDGKPNFYELEKIDNPKSFVKDNNWKPIVTEKEVSDSCY